MTKTTEPKKINCPTIRRQEEQVASGECYLILCDTESQWSKSTGCHANIADAYTEARQILTRQLRQPADAVITDWHGAWPY